MLPRDFFPLSDAARRGLRYAGAQAAIMAGMAFVMADEEGEPRAWHSMAGCTLILLGWVLHPLPGWHPAPYANGRRDAPAAAPDSLAAAMLNSVGDSTGQCIVTGLQLVVGIGHGMSFCLGSGDSYAPVVCAWAVTGGYGMLSRAVRLATPDAIRRVMPDTHRWPDRFGFLGERMAITVLLCSVASLQSGLISLFCFLFDPGVRRTLDVDRQRSILHGLDFATHWTHFFLQSGAILSKIVMREFTPINRHMDFMTRLPGLAFRCGTLTYPPQWLEGTTLARSGFGLRQGGVEVLGLLLDDYAVAALAPDAKHAAALPPLPPLPPLSHLPPQLLSMPIPLSPPRPRPAPPRPAPPPFPEAPYAGGPRLDLKHDRKNSPPVHRGRRARVVRLAGPGPGAGPAPVPVAVAAVVRTPTPGYLSPYALPGTTVGNAPGGPPVGRDHKSH